MGAHELHTTELGDTSVIDTVLDAYVDWREECASVTHAYRCWREAESGQARMSFWAYRAALEREEQAARAYARRIGQVAAADRR